MKSLRNRQDLLTYLTLFPAVRYVEKILARCSSLVDAGCGEASWLRFVKFSGNTMGIDGWEPSIWFSRQRGIHASYVLADLREFDFSRIAPDAILCLDVIEHFEKPESAALLERLVRAARKVVVVVTPNGFVEQIPEDGNEFQRHFCGWAAEELRARGFAVFGILGLKGLRGPFGRIARKPVPFWWLVSKLSEPYVWRHPERAFSLLAIRPAC